jgi:choline dehydrogenase-like flavoprotein
LLAFFTRLTFDYQGGWIRGDANDYDAWSKLVNDPKWSYRGMLPYFRRAEHYHNTTVESDQHGHNGPVYTQSISSSGRDYPLRDRVRAVWESVGFKYTADANSGSPQGIGELIENRNDGARQLASSIYPLGGVQVMTETLAANIIVEHHGTRTKATGVRLADSRTFSATREVILSAGSYRTPQLLMHSGIGPGQELATHGINQLVDAPEVGKNLHDHMSVALWLKLRDQEGAAFGSPKLVMKPAFGKGAPLDWVVTHTVPEAGLKKALTADEDAAVDDKHSQLSPPRSHVESFIVYAASNPSDPAIPMDGSHVTAVVMGTLPTSRGSVRLASSDPSAAPLIDPNYYATEADRYVMRAGLRQVTEAFLNSKEGQALVESETVAEGETPLDSNASDSELDKRVTSRGK